MKVCPNCKNPNVADEAVFCPACGTTFAQSQYQAPAQPAADQYDHTADFDAKDIADNKLYAMLIYALGLFGIIIALIKKGDSAYLDFHLKQGLKIFIVTTVLNTISAVLCWTIIVPFIGMIALCVVFVIQVILFIDVCNNKAKEPILIRSIEFLN